MDTQPVELTLFPIETTPRESTTIEQKRINTSQRITEEKIITPLVEILDSVPQTTVNQPQDVSQSVRKSLDELFPEQRYEEKDLQKAKGVLGGVANEFNDEQLKEVVTEIQYLAETWLDDFERQMFKGLTLKELLHEKGGV